MNEWMLAAVVLLVCGGTAGLLLVVRARPAGQLVGLQLAGNVLALVLLLFARATGNSAYLVVPTVLALLSVAGVLVFTRLLRRA